MIHRDIDDLNSSINQLNLFDTKTILHLTTGEYLFFSIAQETFPKIDHILGYRVNLNTFKIIETIQSRFLRNVGIKRETINRKIV